jgi:PAS domain S-box-containing protein
MSAAVASFADLLAESYAKLVGGPLVPWGMSGATAAAWLYEAPFGLLAHDSSPDPLFSYANRVAQEPFGYSWDEFVGLPSRLSAVAGQARDERQLFMDTVHRQGYADNYRGLRVTKSGRQFWIRDATVWNLIDAESTLVGQAALIRTWTSA